MKKSLLLIVPLTLIASSCSNVSSVESSDSSEMSNSEEVFEITFSEIFKYYFGDDYVLERIDYYYRAAESTPKRTDPQNYPLVMEQLDKCVFHIRDDGKSYLVGDEFILHVTVHNDINTYYTTMTCGSVASTIRLTYGENRDIRADLISFSGEQYYTEAKEMFESLYSYK